MITFNEVPAWGIARPALIALVAAVLVFFVVRHFVKRGSRDSENSIYLTAAGIVLPILVGATFAFSAINAEATVAHRVETAVQEKYGYTLEVDGHMPYSNGDSYQARLEKTETDSNGALVTTALHAVISVDRSSVVITIKTADGRYVNLDDYISAQDSA